MITSFYLPHSLLVLANSKFYAPQFKYFLKDPIKYDVKYQVFFHLPTQQIYEYKRRDLHLLFQYTLIDKALCQWNQYDDFIIPNDDITCLVKMSFMINVPFS